MPDNLKSGGRSPPYKIGILKERNETLATDYNFCTVHRLVRIGSILGDAIVQAACTRGRSTSPDQSTCAKPGCSGGLVRRTFNFCRREQFSIERLW